MFVDDDEVYYPRGGASDLKKKSIKSDRTYVFQNQQPQREVKKKPGRKERLRDKTKKLVLENEENEELESSDAESISYKNIQVGMLSFCSVNHVNPFYINVALPGRFSAILPVESICQPFTNLIEKDRSVTKRLKNYLPIGYCLPCVFTEVIKEQNVIKISVTTDPLIVNGCINFNGLSSGFTLIAAVESCEDHGYVMHTGITGVNAFLPYKNSCAYEEQFNSGDKLGIGQLVWCSVSKVILNETCSIVKLTADPQKVASAKPKTSPPVDVMTPGVQVDVAVTKVTPHLLHVRDISSRQLGYIMQSHLENLWSNTADYKVGTELRATLLYKFPLVNVAHYSLSLKANTINPPEISRGTLFNRAKIIYKNFKGIYVELEYNNEKFKGCISKWKLKQSTDDNNIDDMFPLGNHITVRILEYCNLDRIYSCGYGDDNVKQGCHIADLKIGQLVNVEVTGRNDKIIFAKVCGSEVKVKIPLSHVSDSVEPSRKIKINETYKGRIFCIDNINENAVFVTLCPSLVNNKPLKDFKRVKTGEEYFGVVINILTNGIRVLFFNDLKTIIKATNLPQVPSKYIPGEKVKCLVIKAESDKYPQFSLTTPLGKLGLKIGYDYMIIVKAVTETGLDCIALENNRAIKSRLPLEHLDECPELCPFLLNKYQVGDKINNACLYCYDGQTPVFSLRNSVKTFFMEHNDIRENGMNALEENIVLPATVASIDEKMQLLLVPIPGYNGKIVAKFPSKVVKQLKVNQVIDVIVVKVLPHAGKFFVYYKYDQLGSINKQLTNFLQKLSNYISRDPGDEINAKLTAINAETLEVSLPNNAKGLVDRQNFDKKFKIGSLIKTIYLYDDAKQVSHLCYLSKDLCGNSDDQVKIVHVCENFFVGVSLGSKKIIFINKLSPFYQNLWIQKHGGSSFLQSDVVVHVNVVKKVGKFLQGIVDWRPLISNLACGLNFEKNDDSNMMEVKAEESSMDEDENSDDNVEDTEIQTEDDNVEDIEIQSEHDDSSTKIRNLSKKKKKNGTEEDEEEVPPSKKLKKNTQKNINDSPPNRSLKISYQTESESAKELKKKKLKELENLSFENIGGFDWDATPKDLAKTVAMGKLDVVKEDSDDEVVVKKKLTPAEKKAAHFEAERKLREKEEELLDCEQNPKSVDHFDRLLLGDPNNSKLWIQYMAFHLQGTDIDKARSVARRAIKQINVREEQQKFNVWIALLNLEQLYGTQDSFQQTLTEALKFNDEYEINMKVLGIYCEFNKQTEIDKLTNHLVRKFKSNPKCWLECQSALMKVGLVEKARSFLQRSLSSLPLKEHINLISRFALLENKYGFHDQAQSLFENLLVSYPQRVDLWSVYVDMLVKSNLIDLARAVLERIQSQKLPVRKMRTVYKKWLEFEQNHGTPKSVERVRLAAQQYVTDILPTDKEEDIDDETTKKMSGKDAANSEESTDDELNESQHNDAEEFESEDSTDSD